VPARAASLRAEIEQLGTAGLPAQELIEAISAAVRLHVADDAYFWSAMDPATQLYIGTGVSENLAGHRHFADRLRVTFAAGGLCWGAALLFRRRTAFKVEELQVLHGVAPAVGEALRHALLWQPLTR
jgi:hypothetical protein